MNLWHAFILGVVEGVSEFLPISSTGHLILASRLLGLDASEFLKSFEISIQLAAILAVVVLYWKTLLADREALKRVMVAFVPAAILGFLFYKSIKKYLLGNEIVVVISLIAGGIFLIVFELMHREKESADGEVRTLSKRKAFWIGAFQSLAIVPGVSRSAATIVGGLLLGLKRKTIVEFSFLLAVPTMLAATAYDLLKSASTFSMDQFAVLATGGITSFVVAILSIRFLLGFINRHTFIWFGVYRIVAALLFWFFA